MVDDFARIDMPVEQMNRDGLGRVDERKLDEVVEVD